MPPLAAADAFLVIEFLAGNRRVPLPVFSTLLAALPSVSPHTSPRMRKSVALRALDAALSDASCADPSVRLSRARAVLADPDLAACFPDHLAPRDDLAALKRLVDTEWASLPPSAIEIVAERIAGDGALHTWANADQDTRRKLGLLVGESKEREILSKLGQDPSKVHLVDKVANAPSTSGANEANRAQVDKPANEPSTSGANETNRVQQDDEAHLGRENGKADHVQEDGARQQQEPIEKMTDAQLPEKSVANATIKGKDKATSSHFTGEIAPDNIKSHPVMGGSNAVGESTEREVLRKLGQDPSKVPLVDKAANVPSTSGANEANRVQQDAEARLGRENGKADHVQEDGARQQEPVEKTTDARLPEKSVANATIKGKDKATSSHFTGEIAPDNIKSHPVMGGSKPSLMEKNATAKVFEWGDSGDSDPEMPPRKRRLPTYEMKPRPPPTFPHKRRKRWSEIQEKTLIEGVEKYGKGNWKDIKIAYPAVFEDRSAVDLKDKFRNMERHMVN